MCVLPGSHRLSKKFNWTIRADGTTGRHETTRKIHLFNRGLDMLWWAVGEHRRPDMASPSPCWQWHRLYTAYVTGNRQSDQREVSDLKWQRSFRDATKKKRLRHLKRKARRQKRLERWKAAREEKRPSVASVWRTSI